MRFSGLLIVAASLVVLCSAAACGPSWTNEPLRVDARTIRVEVTNETGDELGLWFTSTTLSATELIGSRSVVAFQYGVEPRRHGRFSADERLWSLVLGDPARAPGGGALGVVGPVIRVAGGYELLLGEVLLQIHVDAAGARWRAVVP